MGLRHNKVTKHWWKLFLRMGQLFLRHSLLCKHFYDYTEMETSRFRYSYNNGCSR